MVTDREILILDFDFQNTFINSENSFLEYIFRFCVGFCFYKMYF